MNIKVKWNELTHDSFQSPEDFYIQKEGILIDIVSGFLGIRTFGIVLTERGTFYKILYDKLTEIKE